MKNPGFEMIVEEDEDYRSQAGPRRVSIKKRQVSYFEDNFKATSIAYPGLQDMPRMMTSQDPARNMMGLNDIHENLEDVIDPNEDINMLDFVGNDNEFLKNTGQINKLNFN
jgi:hypothetical protein